MSVYNIRYMKFFLNKLDWTWDIFRPWLRLRKWCPVVLSDVTLLRNFDYKGYNTLRGNK